MARGSIQSHPMDTGMPYYEIGPGYLGPTPPFTKNAMLLRSFLTVVSLGEITFFE